MTTYKIEDLNNFFFKVDNEGLDYAITDYSNWEEFNGTPLGDAIKKARDSIRELQDLMSEVSEEYDLENYCPE